MASSFYSWIEEVENWLTYSAATSRADLAAEFDILSQEANPLVKQMPYYSLSRALQERGDEEFTLDFTDYLVAKLSEYTHSDLPAKLNVILTMSGSEWAVGRRGEFGALEKRVPDGVRAAADRAMLTGASAGDLFSEAWHAAFGRNPDTEEAYEKAIKAVEAASAEVVLPNNPKATLGTIASAMRDQSDWQLPLGEDPKNPSSQVVVNMVRALWSGQESRHGGNGYRKPSQGEAEAAVLLAVPLVQWFGSGIIARRP